jgi:hypothetical protein
METPSMKGEQTRNKNVQESNLHTKTLGKAKKKKKSKEKKIRSFDSRLYLLGDRGNPSPARTDSRRPADACSASTHPSQPCSSHGLRVRRRKKKRKK